MAQPDYPSKEMSHPEDCECYDCFQSKVVESELGFTAALQARRFKRLDKALAETWPEMSQE